MERNEGLAQIAVNYLEIAHKFEEENNVEKAIENYQLAAEALKKSGYLMERINDIYSRIEELKKTTQKEVVIKYAQNKAQVEEFQNQAFSLLEAAQDLEKRNLFEDAISQYSSAINLLVQAGWTESQIENIKEKINILTGKIEQRVLHPPKEVKLEPVRAPEPQQIEEVKPQITDAFGTKKSPEKAEELRRYQEMKNREEQIQTDAFAFIDNAKFYENTKQYDEAIDSYSKAIELLDSIGWRDQTRNLHFVIEKLKNDKFEHEKFIERQKIEKIELVDTTQQKEQAQARRIKAIEFTESKKEEDSIQTEAFNLIEIGKKLDRERKYVKAKNSFLRAIELLKSIEWDSYIQPIMNLIKDIDKKQEKEQDFDQVKRRRESELQSLQDTIFVKEREELVQTAKDLELRRKSYEQERKEIEKSENLFFKTLDKADKILNESQDYKSAIIEYKNAIELLENLGSGWESYIDTIKTTISSIEKLKVAQIERLTKEQKKLDEKTLSELEFQTQISKELDKERARIKKRDLDLQLRKDELEYFENRKLEAFKALEEAQNFVNQGNFENAIQAYQTAGNTFAGIQWDDELHLIENAIASIEKRIANERILKQKNIQKSIERHKKDQEFQEQISKQLQEEREKLREKQIILRERDKEIEYREKRKDEAFKILEQAQKFLDQSDFDKTIDSYRKATRIFAQIQWYDEVESIGNAIIEIENKKYERELKKQKSLRSLLEKEQSDKEFQDRIIRDMNLQREKLIQKDITIRERESELEFREDKKEEAFKILEEAQNYLSLGKFDMAIESYRTVANMFAQIQWDEELPLINQAINQIEVKKKEKELWKQKTVEDAIKKETAYKRFIDNVKRQRDIEKIKTQKEKDLVEKKKMMTKENLAKQEQVLQEIEEADNLIQQEKYDESILIYKGAIDILNELGWTGGYLKLLRETLHSIQLRQREKDSEAEHQKEILKKHDEEERKFQQKIDKQMLREQKRLSTKAIEIQEKETLKQRMEDRKIVAFNLMDKAEVFLNKNEYRNAIKSYNEAALILREIQFPTDSISEMLQKIHEKQIQEEVARKREAERIRKLQDEEKVFKAQIAEKMKLKEVKMREKQIEIQKQEERKENLEKVKNEAFGLLETADNYMNQGIYEKSLELYHKADLKLSEIQFPSELVKEMKFKLQEKIRERDILKQKELEVVMQREKEERYQEHQMNELMIREKKRLELKRAAFAEQKQIKESQNVQLQSAFQYLDSAQSALSIKEFDKAIQDYQNAGNIFTQLGWEEELPLVQNSIRESTRQKVEYKSYLEKQEKIKYRKEQEEKTFQEDTSKLLNIERENLKQKKLELREREKEVEYREKQRNKAFQILDNARDFINRGDFDKAIELYYQVESIFSEIQWFDEIQIVHNSILEIEREKQERLFASQRELNQKFQKEREETDFQRQALSQLNLQKAELEKKEIKLRVHKEELEFREKGKQKAFTLLDKAQKSVSNGDLDTAKKMYNDVIQIFAEIQWIDEIPLIQQSILDIDNKKKEKESLKQREMLREVQEENVNKEYIEQIQRLREEEINRLLREKEAIQKTKMISAQYLKNQENAFRILEKADDSLRREKFDEASELYSKAITILKEIGWEKAYLILLQETLDDIKNRKQEKENRLIQERALYMKQLEEEKQLEKVILDQFESERNRLNQKQFEIKKKEELKLHLETRKQQAFKLMDQGEILLKEGNYEQAINQYYQAEIILNEISFPTNSVKEMIQKVKEKERERNLTKQQEFETILKKEDEEREFLSTITENLRYKEEKMKTKQIQLRKQEHLKEFMEKRKEDAFELLDEAESFVKQRNYDKALEYYKSAELILNEIQYPTDSLNELILKINEKKREQDILKQKEIEFNLQKGREDRQFQRKITEDIIREKSRLKFKQIEIKKLEEASSQAENKREEAFAMLDQAELHIKNKEYDNSIEKYRKALLFLNEIRYPTESIEAMINKVYMLKKAKQEEENLQLERELEKLEEERNLRALLQERKKQESEKKIARQLAVQQKERLIQDQLTYREAAYSLLEEGGKFLKLRTPDYDKAISLYLQARDLLADKIGWDPEINNLNSIINDLVREKASLVEKRKLEEEVRIKRQKEYELFQQEIRTRRMEYEQQQKEQQRKIKQLYEKQQNSEHIKEEGLNLIDEAKKLAAGHDFNGAYNKFRKAISNFKEIGWEEQTIYIQKEIKNTKEFEEKVKKQELDIIKIHQELERKKRAEESRLKEKEEKIKETAGELVKDISKLIGDRKREDSLEKSRRIEAEAKTFSKDMKGLLNLKQELSNEIKGSRKRAEIEREREQLAKDKEKADEIKEMLKKVSKKKK